MEEFKKNWFLFCSVFIAITSMVSAMTAWIFYNEFDINYFIYADIPDLLMLMFIQPVYLTGFITVLSIYLVASNWKTILNGIRLSLREIQLGFPSIRHETIKVKDFRKLKSIPMLLLRITCMNFIAVFLLVVIIIYFTVASSPIAFIYSKSENIKKNNSSIKSIIYSTQLDIQCAIVIGATSSTIFLWDIIEQTSLIIPKRHIVKISTVLSDPHIDEYPMDREKLKLSKHIQKKDEWNKLLKESCDI